MVESCLMASLPMGKVDGKKDQKRRGNFSKGLSSYLGTARRNFPKSLKGLRSTVPVNLQGIMLLILGAFVKPLLTLCGMGAADLWSPPENLSQRIRHPPHGKLQFIMH